MKLKGVVAAAFALLVWGFTFVNTRALLIDFSALEIQLIRFVTAWVVLFLIGLVRGEKMRWYGRDERLFAAMGLTGVLVYQLLENCAIYYTNASNVAILISFCPIMTAFLARAFTKDKSLSLKMVMGSVLAIVGVSLVSWNGIFNFDLSPVGNIMALAAMMSWGVYSIFIEKANERGIDELIAIRKAFAWALLMTLPIAVWGGSDYGFSALNGILSVDFDIQRNAMRFTKILNITNLFFLGVLASALSFIAWSKACAVLGLVKMTVCLYLESLIGVLFAAIFLGERLTFLSSAGAFIIIIGVVVANYNKQAKRVVSEERC